MNKSKTDKTIYDAGGRPIATDDSAEEGNLPVGVQALIETRINEAIDRLREHNQVDLKNLASDHAKKWRHIALVTTAVAIISAFVAPIQIPKWIQGYIEQHMTEPRLKDAADEAIRTKMSEYVDERISPLNLKADDLSDRINALGNQISAKQDQIEINQKALQEQLHIQQLSAASKTGSYDSYLALKDMARLPSEYQTYSEVALKEVELYYDADRSQLAYDKLVDSVSLQDPGYSIEEVFQIYHSSPGFREAAINTLSGLNRKSAVQYLCRFLDSEKNVRVLARTTLALEKLTGQRFRPLDFEAARAWCAGNCSMVEYQSPYDGYLRACEITGRGNIRTQELQGLLPGLEETIKADPEALHARCLKGGFLALLGNYAEAEEEFNQVEKVKNDFRWLLFWKSALLVKQEKTDEAINLINRALAKSPALGTQFRHWKVFSNLYSHPNIKWHDDKSRSHE